MFREKLIKSGLVSKEWIEFAPEAFDELEGIFQLLKNTDYTPSSNVMFRAYNECLPENVKVVILGMDPYFDGSGTGLCFDNKITQKRVSPSLRNILHEMQEDLGGDIVHTDSYLGHLPKEGVLLINCALTSQRGEAGKHIVMWKNFTEKIIVELNKRDNISWIVWGAFAKGYMKNVSNTTHKIIEGGHPSPMNRSVPFMGGRYFTKANKDVNWLNTEIKE